LRAIVGKSGSSISKHSSPTTRQPQATTRTLSARAARPAGAEWRAGVTFAISMAGARDEDRAARQSFVRRIDSARSGAAVRDDALETKPGRAKREVEAGPDRQTTGASIWKSGIGPDASVHSKAPTDVSSSHVMSRPPASEIGTCNNPIPEVVLVVSSRRLNFGALLGKRCHLRTFEGARPCCCPRPRTQPPPELSGPRCGVRQSCFARRRAQDGRRVDTVKGQTVLSSRVTRRSARSAPRSHRPRRAITILAGAPVS